MSDQSPNAIGPLALPSAPQAAAQTLREAIISGELKGGERILEQKWSRMLGIGQPTLREAMRELEHQGLLRKTPQRGTFVAELSPDDYRQILEVRIPLEAMAVALAAAHLTPEAERELEDLIAGMAASEHDTDTRRFHDCDVMFHRSIWDLAGNSYLRDLLETITIRLFVFSVVGRWPGHPKAADERRAAIEQHEGIVAGIRTGDPAKAQRAFVEHTVEYWNRQYGLSLNKKKLFVVPFRK